MATNILMPALSPTMEQGTLAKWLKKEGDSVKSGDVIAEIETDKATMEVEAVDEGTLAKILIPDGTENVAVNTPIAIITEEGEDASATPASTAPSQAADTKPGTGEGAKLKEQGRREAGLGPQKTASDAPLPVDVASAGAPKSPRAPRWCRPPCARGVARRHGGRDAPRWRCLRDGRGGCRIPGRLQDHARVCCRSSARGASSTRRSRSTGSRASASAQPWPG